MKKRVRTQQRFNELFSLAEQRHSFGWTDEESRLAFRSWVAKNPDLYDGNAINTARLDFEAMACPRLSGWLQTIKALAEKIMNKEPPGTKRRFNHEFLKICRAARDHKVSVSAALDEIALPDKPAQRRRGAASLKPPTNELVPTANIPDSHDRP